MPLVVASCNASLDLAFFRQTYIHTYPYPYTNTLRVRRGADGDAPYLPDASVAIAEDVQGSRIFTAVRN